MFLYSYLPPTDNINDKKTKTKTNTFLTIINKGLIVISNLKLNSKKKKKNRNKINMFRQTKKRIASRRNFDSYGDVSSDSLQSGKDNFARINSKDGNFDSEKEHYDTIYSNKLSFYETPPKGEITLEQFETWAISRLKILLEIESGISRNKNLNEIETLIKPHFNKFFPLNSDNYIDKKKDYYSHYILRLCFCRTKELREKFVRAETFFFKIRYQMLNSSDQIKFVQSLNLPLLQHISDNEKNKYSKELYQTISSQLQFQLNLTDEQQRQNYFQNEKFIKLPFENVIEMVGNRSVFLREGYAYLPQFQQLNLIASEFANKLQDQLIKTFQYLPRLNEDDRLIPILNHLSSGYTISDFNENSNQYGNNEDGDITAESVWSERISKHYPLCIRNLFKGLKEHHHLRYYGRQQLSLFLKGIGLSADESMKFWTKAFTDGGHMSLEKFNKEYRYNFRHNYGLEGNRINYKPWDCKTILSKPRPGRGDYHGYPFRDWSSDKLTVELAKLGLTKSQINSVLDSCENGDYIIANTKVFEYTHNLAGSEFEKEGLTLMDHPNLYFERSRQLEKKQQMMTK